MRHVIFPNSGMRYTHYLLNIVFVFCHGTAIKHSFMAKIDTQRHQIIRQALLQRPEAALEVTIDLWERLASKLIAIIGEGGFESLYARSVHLTNVDFSWIVLDPSSQQSVGRFAALRSSLEGRDVAEMREASVALMITFVDILCLLIGALLTTSILSSAWGDDVVKLAEKELRE